jgi:hypothetical protein
VHCYAPKLDSRSSLAQISIVIIIIVIIVIIIVIIVIVIVIIIILIILIVINNDGSSIIITANIIIVSIINRNRASSSSRRPHQSIQSHPDLFVRRSTLRGRTGAPTAEKPHQTDHRESFQTHPGLPVQNQATHLGRRQEWAGK